MATSFRHSAGFGKRIEYYVVGLMLKQGLDVYMPLVDDDAIDAVIKRDDGSFVEVQIKARSSTAKLGDMCARTATGFRSSSGASAPTYRAPRPA